VRGIALTDPQAPGAEHVRHDGAAGRREARLTLEPQTGVSYVTLLRHYGRWMAGEVASKLRPRRGLRAYSAR